MVPINDYATVPVGATLLDAIHALEEAQWRYNQKSHHHHRAMIVIDEKGHPVGKLSQWVVLRALEPRYRDICDDKALGHFGLSGKFVKSMIGMHGLWQKPLDDLAGKASRLKVKDIMYIPAEGEFVREGATLDEAIHQMVLGHHQSLLVMKNGTLVGVLRLVDVFTKICELIKDMGSRS
jgi:predicted transcriptional regulator